MAALGMALIALGIIGLIYGIMQRMKAGRVTDAPLATTGDVVSRGAAVAGPKGQVSAQGNVMCQQPIYSPVTGTPCLFYELKVTSEWKDGDTTKKKELDHQKVAAQFAINDGSGPLWVDLRQGGDFEPTQKKEQEQSTGLLKGIVGGEIVFGNYRLQSGIGSLGTTYKVEETVLPVQQSLYVCGRLAETGGMITAPSWRSMIVSNKTRAQLLAAATKTAKIALIAGGAGLVVGIALAVIGSMMSSKEAEAEAAAAASAALAAGSASAAATDMPSADPSDAPSASGTAAVPAKKGFTAPTKATASAKATAGASATPAATATAKASAAPSVKATTGTPITPPKPKK
jgi:hypothetical protein